MVVSFSMTFPPMFHVVRGSLGFPQPSGEHPHPWAGGFSGRCSAGPPSRRGGPLSTVQAEAVNTPRPTREIRHVALTPSVSAAVEKQFPRTDRRGQHHCAQPIPASLPSRPLWTAKHPIWRAVAHAATPPDHPRLA